MTDPGKLTAALLAVCLWLGFAVHASDTTAEPSGEVVVLAAASLTAAFADVALSVRDTHPGLEVVYNFAGSQALRTQLEQGATADVFASANDTQMRRALDGGLIEGAPQVFARNTLMVIVPADNPGRITGFKDLAKDGLKLALAGPQVPAGRYSREALQAAQAEYGTDFAARVLLNLASEETSVKQVLVKVQLGEADAGIVYASDVAVNTPRDVSAIPIPDAHNRLAEYPIAVTQTAQNPTGAAAFIRYLLSAPGQATLAAHGFIPVTE